MRIIILCAIALLVMAMPATAKEQEVGVYKNLLKGITIVVLDPEVNKSPIPESEVESGFRTLLENKLQEEGFTVLHFADTRTLEKAYKDREITADLIILSTISFEIVRRERTKWSSGGDIVDSAEVQGQVVTRQGDDYVLVAGIENEKGNPHRESVYEKRSGIGYSQLRPSLSTLAVRTACGIAAKIVEDLLGSASTPPEDY